MEIYRAPSCCMNWLSCQRNAGKVKALGSFGAWQVNGRLNRNGQVINAKDIRSHRKMAETQRTSHNTTPRAKYQTGNNEEKGSWLRFRAGFTPSGFLVMAQ